MTRPTVKPAHLNRHSDNGRFAKLRRDKSGYPRPPEYWLDSMYDIWERYFELIEDMALVKKIACTTRHKRLADGTLIDLRDFPSRGHGVKPVTGRPPGARGGRRDAKS